MKIYFAGNAGSEKREDEWENLTKRLVSYYYIQTDEFAARYSFEKIKKKIQMDKKVELFLDSGAFSALTQKKEVKLEDYIQFIKDNESVIKVYANLDVIDPVDPDRGARLTWKNQKLMEEAGLNPLPCFHFKDDIKWLVRYLNTGYEYIALGGAVGVPIGSLKKHLDNVFKNYICDSSGMPKVKVHGFGLTSVPLMVRYPWYSVDSTSWIVTGRMGTITIPTMEGFHKIPWKITVSNRSPKQKDSGQHISTLSPQVKKYFLDYIHEKGYELGKSEFRMESQLYELKENERWAEKKPKDKSSKREVETIVEPGVCNTYQLRDELNIIYFLDLEKSLPEWPWAFESKNKQNELF